MPNVKVIIAFAAAAGLLSFFAGVFGGVPFGTIVLRMFLGAAAFGALGAVISLLAERFMPELFSTESTEGQTEEEAEAEPAAEGPQQGSQVDIVLEDEGETSPDFSAESGGEEEPDEEDRFIEEVRRAGEETEAAAASGETGAESGTSGAAAYAGGGNGTSGGGADAAAAASGTEEYGESQSGVSAGEGGEDEGVFEHVNDIDELPDLEDYADSFESVAADTQSEGDEGYRGASSGAVDIDGEQEDPATVAKALRKFMKNDEEG
jgi:hypothetical protein